MDKKRKYGQFYSANADQLLFGFAKPPINCSIIEPFSGKGDLIRWVNRDDAIEYDIEPRRDQTTCRDTLRNPPSYSGKYIVTHPPFLARNKSTDKSLYDTFGLNDLFKIFITQICNDPPIGGVLILPVNFWSSSRDPDVELRKEFLSIFRVLKVNIFEEAVFQDTSCAVSSVQFTHDTPTINISFRFFPDDEERVFLFSPSNHYTIGWDIISIMDHKYGHVVTRAVVKGKKPNTQLMFRALDNISLEWTDKPYYGKKTSRTFASLNIEPQITKKRQKELLKQFNEFVSLNRAKYKSLWLSNYREGARKRMGFEMCYSIVGYLLRS